MDLDLKQKFREKIKKERRVGNLFYVYLLCFSDTKDPYYVGKGSYDRVFVHLNSTKGGDNSLLSRYIRKFEFNVIFDSFYNKEDDSFIREIELINLYGRKDLNLGSLLNRTNGGEGFSGATFSEYTRKLRARIFATSEYRTNLSEAMKRSWTDERKKEGSETLIRLYSENPERKIQVSKTVEKSWKNPEVRKKRCEGLRKAFNTEEWKKGQSMRTANFWADPKRRNKRLIPLLKALNSPVYKKVQSDGAKDLWGKRKSIIDHCKKLIQMYSLLVEFPRLNSSLDVLRSFEQKLLRLTKTMAPYNSDVICKKPFNSGNTQTGKAVGNPERSPIIIGNVQRLTSRLQAIGNRNGGHLIALSDDDIVQSCGKPQAASIACG